MSESRLCYLSVNQLSSLVEDVANNIARYKTDGFEELSVNAGWKIPTEIECDLTEFKNLVPASGVDNEVNNSLIVWRALYRMPAALATENRVWTRLSHVEGFEYSKGRWLNLSKSDTDIEKQVVDHFFAPSLTRYRDDHAIGRLWWNAYIAKLLQPEDQEHALKLMLTKADIRSSLVERSLSLSRPEIGRALLRCMDRIPGTCSEEDNFREFMKQVNKYGGKTMFEIVDQDDCDTFMDDCWSRAETSLGET